MVPLSRNVHGKLAGGQMIVLIIVNIRLDDGQAVPRLDHLPYGLQAFGLRTGKKEVEAAARRHNMSP